MSEQIPVLGAAGGSPGMTPRMTWMQPLSATLQQPVSIQQLSQPAAQNTAQNTIATTGSSYGLVHLHNTSGNNGLNGMIKPNPLLVGEPASGFQIQNLANGHNFMNSMNTQGFRGGV
jgi:hypothetical protein